MDIQRMLVAVDFSDASQAAAHYAAEHFAPAAQVILLCAIDPPDRPAFARDKLPPEGTLEAIAREDAALHFQTLARALPGASVRAEIRIGKPYEQVAAVAVEMHADLVVIGPHGDRPRPSRFLGTTADRIVRTCPTSVLVATNPTAHAPRRILVPVDDNGIVDTLLARTRDLAETFDADVTLLHVWSNAVYSHVASMSHAASRTEAAARSEIDKEFHHVSRYWLEEIARTGIARDRVSVNVAYGNAGDVTVATAAALGADLIVLGRRGAGLVAPALLGSTVGTVLHGARCPVLVVSPARERSDG